MDIKNTDQLVEWAIARIDQYNKDRKIYNITAIILSVIDVLCGIFAIFYNGLLAVSVLASIACGTAWGARFIQIIKGTQLANAIKNLKTANALSLSYIAVRKKRSEFMKNIKVRNIVIAVVTVLGFASVLIFNLVPALAELAIWADCAALVILPFDLYATFNNAKSTAEEIAQKVEEKKLKEAEKLAKKELEAKQEAELKALAEIKKAELEAEIKAQADKE